MRNRVSLAALCVALALACPARATVTSTASSASYTCTGSVSTFTIPFPYLAASQIVAVETDASGVATTVIGTVKPSIAPTSGTLTLPSACPSGSTLSITRSVALTQPQSFRTGSYSGAAHEQAFDRLEMQAQQNAATHATDKAAQTAKDAAQDLSIAAVNGNVSALNTGSHAVTDASSVLAFGSTTPRTLTSRFADVANVKDYGAKGDGIADDTAAVLAAYSATASGASAAGAAIYFPAGKYKFNLTIARSGVRIIGSGRARVADTTPVGGSIFVPADLTKPIIQIGDGTSTVEKVTVEHFSMLGDGTFTTQGTATSDGIVLNGVYNATISDFEIGFMGGRSAYLTSGTKATSYNHFVNGEFINYSRYGVLVDYGASWTTANYFDHCNFSPAQVGAGDYGMRVEGSSVYVANSWFQALNGHAHIYLLKDAGGHAPNLQLTNTFVDTGGNPTWVVMDINIGGAHQLPGMYVVGSSYRFDGLIRWDDGTTVDASGNSQVVPSSRFVSAKIGQKLYFDLWQNSLGTEFNDASTPPILLQGKERTTGGTTPILEMTGAHFRIPGTFGQALEFATPSASLWPNATTKRLHYLPTSLYPGNDLDGAPFTPLSAPLTYSASITPAADKASRFVIAANNATAFTINNPLINSFNVANFSDYRMTITVSNTSAAALGAATWGTAYKMAAWTQPAAGFQRSITFAFDGTANWYEISRTPADVPN